MEETHVVKDQSMNKNPLFAHYYLIRHIIVSKSTLTKLWDIGGNPRGQNVCQED